MQLFSAPSLVNQPAGLTASCSYTVSFGTTGSQLTAPAAGTFSAAAPQITRSFAAVSETTFTPAVSVTVPVVDDGSGGNVFDGATVTVTFTRSGGPDARCSATVSETWVIGADGAGVRSANAGTLLDRPLGSASRCVYTVGFSDTITVGEEVVALDPASVTLPTVSAASNGPVAAEYTIFVETAFAPAVSVTVPVADDGAGGNVFDGATVLVNFSRSAGPTEGCSGGFEAWVIGADGMAVRPADAADLVDRPLGSAESCVYDVRFPDSIAVGNVLVFLDASSVASASVSAAANSPVAAVYVADVETSFTPAVSVVSPVVDDGSGGNVFDGATVTVSFSLLAGPALGCSSATEAWVIGADGSAARPADAADLVDKPLGTTSRCIYEVGFSETVTVGGDVLLLDVTTILFAIVSAEANGPVTAGYALDTSTTFTPAVTATSAVVNAGSGGNVFAGASVRVIFSPAAGPDAVPVTGCSLVAETWVVGADGAIIRPGDAADLVDQPDGATSRCVYNVSFQSTVAAGGRVLTLDTTSVASATVSAAANGPVAAVYTLSAATSFAPAVSVSSPVVADGSGGNLFDGSIVMVSFSLAAGPAEGCSIGFEFWEINSSGAAVRPSTASDLIDQPAGATERCVYDVSFSDMVAALGNVLVLDASSVAAATVSAVANGPVAAVYLLQTETTFVPTVIAVTPVVADGSGGNLFEGARVAATFSRSAGPAAGCSTATQTLTIDDEGFAEWPDDAAGLVDQPQDMAGRCVYDVEFSAALTAAGMTLALDATSVASATTSAEANTLVAAIYMLSPETTFAPAVAIAVPQIDADGDGVNDFAGTGFEVGFAPVAESDAACASLSGTDTWQVLASGAVGLQGSGVVLVAHPQGMPEMLCSYDVTFPESAGDLMLASAAAAVVNSGASSAAASYEARPAPTPPPDDGDGGDPGGGTPGGGTPGGGTPVPVQIEARPSPVLSSQRLPVTVSVRVSGDRRVFASGEAFAVRVSSPGVCGSDTMLFGGVLAQRGVFYGVRAQAGELTVIGPGAATANPAASYTLPEFAVAGDQMIPCVLRVTEFSAPQGCTVSSAGAGRDASGSPFVEVAWTQGAAGFDASLDYVCDGSVSTLVAPAGWHIIFFNGADGLSPQDFAASLDNVVSSIWRWDVASQSWQGWTAAAGDRGLGVLSRGEVVMVFVPATRTVQYSPANLLGPAEPITSLTLQPARYSQHIYNGQAPVAVASLAGDSRIVVFRWDVPTQMYQQTDTLQPGDGALIYNLEPTPATIAWR